MRKRLLDYAVWLGILLCCIFLATALVAVKGAFAQEVSTGQGVICDTREQLERYVALYEKGQLSTVVADKVNKEVGKETACGVAHIAFVVRESFDQVRTADGPYTVTEIIIVAANLGHGWQRVMPFVQFILVAVNEVES